jgi:ferredoxin-NADP reductase
MRLYTRTTPRAGVLSLTTLFPRVLIVTTGSGIGPSLSSLLHRPPSQHIRLIWSTRSPLATYGASLLALVHRADPEAVIIDTDVMGRPNLVEVAWRECRRMRGEAVFVLGNEGVTRRVVGGLEGRGVPAFGPVWDS